MESHIHNTEIDLLILVRDNKGGVITQFHKRLNKKNMHLIKFKIEHELSKLKLYFIRLKTKNIINSIAYPKANLRKNRNLIKELLISRRNLQSNLIIVKNFIKSNLKNNSNV